MTADAPLVPTGGIDWATDTNELCVVDPTGDVLHRSNTTMDAAGIRKLVGQLERHSVDRVAIERPDGPVVDALLAADIEVVVITPRQVKNLRSRYGSATRVALCNQLRAHLKIVFPGAVGLFRDLDSPISLKFLTRFPTADKAAWLSVKRFGAWLSANRYSGRTKTTVLLDRLTSAPAGHTGDAGDAAGRTTLAYVAALQAICEQIRVLEADIAEQLAVHPDAHIFRSLPRCQVIRAAKLLVDAVMDFAGDSRHASPWAAAIYDRHIAQNKTHQHAVRILARAWLRVIWRCWQDGAAYDPALHGGAQKAQLTATA